MLRELFPRMDIQLSPEIAIRLYYIILLLTRESSKSLFPLVPKLKQAVIEVFGSCFNDRCIDISILIIL